MKNNVNKITVSVYENLVSGGAERLLRSNLMYLKEQYNLVRLSDKSNTQSINSFFSYMRHVVLYDSNIAEKLSHQLKDSKILLGYHSWVTKSPSLIRYVNYLPILYICHEPPREFYDKEYMSSFSLKEKLINMIRLPLKYLDYINVVPRNNLYLVANSKFSEKIINKVYGKKSEVIYPGIKLLRFGKHNSLYKRENQIICVGSINKLKNQLFILECVNKIASRKKPKILLIGNGGDKEYILKLKEYAKTNHLRLKIELNISEKKLISAYKKSRIFCYAPINEPFGIVVIEALRAGLPIIASITGGGHTEILSEKNGYLLPTDNMHTWAESISKLLSNNELWKKMSKRNYTDASKYSDSVMNRKLNKYIISILKST